jgi:hypothetical protein
VVIPVINQMTLYTRFLWWFRTHEVSAAQIHHRLLPLPIPLFPLFTKLARETGLAGPGGATAGGAAYALPEGAADTAEGGALSTAPRDLAPLPAGPA